MSIHRFAFGFLPLACSFFVHAPPDDERDGPDDEPKPVRLEIKIDSALAHRIATPFCDALTKRYELTDDQAQRMTDAMSRRFLKVATQNQQAARTLLEATLSSLITNGGQWTPEIAQEFGKQIQSELPALRKSISGFTEDIRGELTLTQKAKFTADYAEFLVGFTYFESRMKKWGEGKVGEWPSLFRIDEAEDLPTTQPDGKVLSREVVLARHRAKDEIAWFTKWDGNWEAYIQEANKAYGFSEAQMESAKAILKSSRQRLVGLNTPEHLGEVEKLLIVQCMLQRAGDALNSGPFAQQLNRRVRQAFDPYRTLTDEFQRRIDDLADSSQRTKAQEAAWAAIGRLGYSGPRI